MTSGELARIAGVSVDTLHHYERVHVLPPASRRENGYRDYPPEAAQRVQMIRRALAVGFTLDELARVFRMRDAGNPPCATVRKLAAGKLEAIDSRIADLQALRESLIETMRDWDTRLAQTPAGQPAHLLESLKGAER
jgi:DNA-binding transcriptional MerR regulator